MAGSSILRKTVVAGALSAVSVALFLTPFGYIPWLAGASLTIMHVPAIIAGVLEGPWVGAVVGGIFGVSSLVKAATTPTGPIDTLFTNPLVSVLPRILVGIGAWAVFAVFRGRMTALASALAGIAGSFVNSILVLGLLVVMGGIALPLAASIFVANSLVEAAAAGILTLGVVLAWKGVEGGGRAKLADEEKKK